MFRWDHKYSIEVNASIKDAWDFFTNPSHWPKWERRFDVCFLIGDFKPGTPIKAKIKDKPIHIIILITEVKPYSEYRALVQNLFFRQESLVIFKELSSGITQITFQVCVLGPFVPFLKSTLLKNAEQAQAKLIETFMEHSEQAALKNG